MSRPPWMLLLDHRKPQQPPSIIRSSRAPAVATSDGATTLPPSPPLHHCSDSHGVASCHGHVNIRQEDAISLPARFHSLLQRISRISSDLLDVGSTLQSRDPSAIAALLSEVETLVSGVEHGLECRLNAVETPLARNVCLQIEERVDVSLRETAMARCRAIGGLFNEHNQSDDDDDDCSLSVSCGRAFWNKKKVRKIEAAKGLDSARDAYPAANFSQSEGLDYGMHTSNEDVAAAASASLHLLSPDAAREEASFIPAKILDLSENTTANVASFSASPKHRKRSRLAKESGAWQATVAQHTLDLVCNESMPWGSFSDDQENDIAEMQTEIEAVDKHGQRSNELQPIGEKVATAGWYVSDGHAVLLAHDDGSCSFFDVANMEEKAVYRRPGRSAPISFDDCWLVRAAGSDGSENKYIVAATCGSAMDTGFCSWDFHSRIAIAQELNDSCRNTETSCRWYKPHGPLLASAAAFHRTLSLHDIRDGAIAMTWSTERHILRMDFSSPLQWTAKSCLVLAENEAISVWDVNTMDARCLQSIELPEMQIRALHVHAADGDGGIRRRLSLSEMDAYDGICCTEKDIKVMDFRVRGGIGMSFRAATGSSSSSSEELQSVFARGDAILTGGVNRNINECGMHQWSARTGKLVCSYAFPPSTSHYSHLSLAQIWGSSSVVMAVNGNGVHLYPGLSSQSQHYSAMEAEVEDVLGTQDLFNPSFDYAHSRLLLITRDRPACCCIWPYQSQLSIQKLMHLGIQLQEKTP